MASLTSCGRQRELRSEPALSKVLLVTLNYAPEQTGIGPYSADFSQFIASRSEWAMDVVTTYPHYPQWKTQMARRWSSRTEEHGVNVQRKFHYVPHNPTNRRRLLAEISFALRCVSGRWKAVSVVIAVSPSLFASVGVLIRAKIFQIPSVLWVQDVYSTSIKERGAGRITQFLMSGLERLAVRLATHTVVIHDSFRTQIVEFSNISLERISVVKNWLKPVSEPPSDSEVLIFRQSHGWDLDDVVFFYSGAQGTKQGLVKVIETIASEPSDPRIRWVIAGDGSEREAIQTASRGVANVEVLGFLTDTDYRMCLAAADVTVITEAPGMSEGAVPSKLTSYFQAGKPVLGILNEQSLARSEIELAEAGICVGHEAAAVLGGARELCDDVDGRQILGENGRRYASKYLGRDFACDSLLNILLQVSL